MTMPTSLFTQLVTKTQQKVQFEMNVEIETRLWWPAYAELYRPGAARWTNDDSKTILEEALKNESSI